MAHKTLIGGTAYEITGGKTLVDGTAYSIKSGKTLVGGTAYEVGFGPSILDNFADTDWESIIFACQNNLVPTTWAVGDQKAMTINGADYVVDIIGKNHDTYSDASGTAPLTFQLHDCYGTKYKINPLGTYTNWAITQMRSTHLPAILALMPTEVQSAIKMVNKPTVDQNSTTITTTEESLFLLSEIEVLGTITNSVSGEGSQYEYYKNGNSRIKKLISSATLWWLRSPPKNNKTSYCVITNKGDASFTNSFNEVGVAFGFCF